MTLSARSESVISNWDRKSLRYLRNNGDRTLTDVTEDPLENHDELLELYHGLTRLQDIDGDGDIHCFADNRRIQMVWLNDGNGHLNRHACRNCW